LQFLFIFFRYHKNGGTGKAIKHLQTVHGIEEEANVVMKRLKRSQSSIQQAMARAAEKEYERRLQAPPKRNEELPVIDPDALEDLYVRWITRRNIPFKQVEWIEFQDFIQYISPQAAQILPISGPSIKNWVIRTFDREKERVKEKLSSALSSIHFTLDLWTSTNNLALLAVISHFTEANGQLSHAVLSMKEIEGEHTGANLAKTFISVAKEYGVMKKVGYFVMDNATSNDTLIECIEPVLNELGITFNPMERRLRYVQNFRGMICIFLIIL